MELEFHQIDLRYEALRTRDPRRERQVLASLAEVGQTMPIVVVADGDGRRIVVDGYKRVRALKCLGRDVVWAVAWELAEVDALVLERLMRQAGSETALEQAWLLVELRDRFALSIEELGRRFSRSPSWVSRRLALAAALPAEVQEHVRRGAIVAHGAMRYLVPLARANRDDCVRLGAAIARAHLTTRQLATLYAAYQAASEASVRERLLCDPLLYLASVAELSSTRAGAGKNAALPGAAALIGADLGLLLGVAGRLARRLIEGRAAELAPEERTQSGRSFAQVRAAVARLEELGPQEWKHAR